MLPEDKATGFAAGPGGRDALDVGFGQPLWDFGLTRDPQAGQLPPMMQNMTPVVTPPAIPDILSGAMMAGAQPNPAQSVRGMR